MKPLTVYYKSIKYVDYGVANNFGSHIELHKDLKDYPALHNAILDHELQHTDKSWSVEDFKLDFLKPLNCSTGDLFGFMASRPSTWIQILPVYFRNKKVIVDINLSILWSFIMIFLLGLVWFVSWMQ